MFFSPPAKWPVVKLGYLSKNKHLRGSADCWHQSTPHSFFASVKSPIFFPCDIPPFCWIIVHIESPDFQRAPSQPPCSHGDSSLIATDAQSRDVGMMCQSPRLDFVRHLKDIETVSGMFIAMKSCREMNGYQNTSETIKQLRS